jgi:hypothetical protein
MFLIRKDALPFLHLLIATRDTALFDEDLLKRDSRRSVHPEISRTRSMAGSKSTSRTIALETKPR